VNPVPLRAVVDASVAVKNFVPEALSAQAQSVFTRFASENGGKRGHSGQSLFLHALA